MWGWIIGSIAALGVGYALVSAGKDDGRYEGRSKGAGWYVLLLDRIGEERAGSGTHKLPGGVVARIKEWRGAFDTKDEAEAAARAARDEGWKGTSARAVVDYRGRAPW